MVRSHTIANPRFVLFETQVDLKVRVGNLSIQEVRALEVGVPLWVTSVNCCCVNGDLYGGLGDVSGIQLQNSGKEVNSPFTFEIIMCLTLNCAVK